MSAITTTTTNEPSTKSLLEELSAERQKSARLQAQIDKFRTAQGQMQRVMEQEEEAITNRMLRHLDTLQTEKEQLARSVEQEEEYISNTLIKKLEQLRQEKVALESQLEKEEEFIVNRVQQQRSSVPSSSSSSSSTAGGGGGGGSRPSTPRGESSSNDLRKKIEFMEVLIVQLRAKLMTMAERCREVMEQNTKLANAIAGLRKENFKLWSLSPVCPPPQLPPDPQPQSPQAPGTTLTQSLDSNVSAVGVSNKQQKAASSASSGKPSSAQLTPQNRPVTTPPRLSSSSSSSSSSYSALSTSSATVVKAPPSALATKWAMEASSKLSIAAGGRVRASSDADLMKFMSPRSQLLPLVEGPADKTRGVAGIGGHAAATTTPVGPMVKVLLEGKVCTKLETEPDLMECQFAVLSSGHLRMHAIGLNNTSQKDIIIELHSLVGITEVDPQTIKLKCKKDSSPARLLSFPTGQDTQSCVALLREMVSLPV